MNVQPRHVALNAQSGRERGQPITDRQRKNCVMHIIGTLFIGLLIGIVAKFLMPGRDPGGWIITILLGLAGSFLARYIGTAAGWYGPDDAAGFFASVLGAIVLLAAYRALAKRGQGRLN